MSLVCPHCSHTIEYTGDPPRFCSYCGQSLSTNPAEAPTLQYDAATPGTVTSAPATPSVGGAVPDVIGGYKLVRTLGGGGMGTVYEAEQTTTGRHVALKLIAPQYSTSKDTVERFRQEGRLASAIAHPRCVFVVAAEEEAGRPYIVMELMPGDTLDDLIRREGPLPPKKAIHKILDVIDGLQEAHRLGVIHRDVKPSNCFNDKDGRVKIGDFGLSKSLASDQQLTKTGSFLGTVLYSSPEQVRRETLDQQTDVYSVAATLYFLLTGRAPYQTGDAMATIAQILADPPTPPRQVRPDIPPALERVVLKGLERNRDKRFRDLGEFRDALMPFLQRDLGIGSVGWRFLAYVIDVVLLFLVMQVVEVAVMFSPWAGDFWARAMDPQQAPALQNDPIVQTVQYIQLAAWLLYFFVLEGLFGCTLGKYLCRLRVFAGEQDDPAGWGPIALRTLLCFLLTHLDSLLGILALRLGWVPSAPPTVDPAKMLPELMVVAGVMILVQYVSWFAGLGAMFCTMRTRNGHRGLHELLSGTRVVRIPEKRPAPVAGRLHRQFPEPPLHGPTGMPERVGPFAIQGALRWDEREKVLLGEDTILRRRVWVWLHGEGRQSASAERQALSRAARLRWLMSGTHDGQPWDALVAPAGARLADIVAAQAPLSWSESRPLLEQLTYELVISDQEWTLPDSLTIDQVWIQPGGRAVLVDVPLAPPPAPPAAEEVPYVLTEADRSLALLWQTATLALEGKPRAAGDTDRRVRAPLPGYAAQLLVRLPDSDERVSHPEEFQARLTDLRDQPDEVSRFRRLVHLIVLTLLSSLWLFCCIPTQGWFMSPGFMALFPTHFVNVMINETREELSESSARELGAAQLIPDPWARLASVAVHDGDLKLAADLEKKAAALQAEKQAILDRVSPLQRWSFASWEKMMAVQEKPMKQAMRQRLTAASARRTARDVDLEQLSFAGSFGTTYAMVQVGLLAVWPLLYILWAGIIGGGLSYRIAGIALMRRDGRPASRLQCLWRAFLVWAPAGGLLVLSLYLDGRYWAQWQNSFTRDANMWLLHLSMVAWYAGLLWLAASAALALIFPRRSLHDWLAGTYLVPR